MVYADEPTPEWLAQAIGRAARRRGRRDDIGRRARERFERDARLGARRAAPAGGLRPPGDEGVGARRGPQRGGVSEGLFLSWAPFSRRTETLAEVFGLDLRFVSSPVAEAAAHCAAQVPRADGAYRRACWASERPASLWVMDPPSPARRAGRLHARRRGERRSSSTCTPWRSTRRAGGCCAQLELPALRAARAAIVTNEALAARLRRWGAPAFVLPDPLPRPVVDPAWTVEPGAVTVVATFSPDEPLDLLPEVAARCPELTFYVTGHAEGRPQRLAREPQGRPAFSATTHTGAGSRPRSRRRAHDAPRHAALRRVRGDGARAAARDLRPRRAARVLRRGGRVRRRRRRRSRGRRHRRRRSARRS